MPGPRSRTAEPHDDRGAHDPVGAHRHAAGAVLVLAMAAGSIAMWLVAPLAWLWIASHLTSSTQPSIGPYLLVLAGMAVTVVVLGKLLGTLNRMHMRVTGLDRPGRQQTTWLKSMRGERVSTRPRGVLEPVMAISVSVAFVLFGIWFFAFAGSSLPGS